VWLERGVFGLAVGVPGWCEGEDYEEGVDWGWDQGKEIRVGEGVDVVELEGR